MKLTRSLEPNPDLRIHFDEVRFAHRGLTVVNYVESAAGVAADGLTGVTAIVTGPFLAVLFVEPLVCAIPAAGTVAGPDRGRQADGRMVAEVR